MQDGRALQSGTSHLLSENFPKAFGVEFQDKDGQLKTPWCSSWGSTTRMIGALIMVHGDEAGLVLPPKVAPIQVMVVPIFKTPEQKELVLGFVEKILAMLSKKGIRVQADLDESKSPGFKFNETEMRGIPLRIEVGPRDVESKSCTVVARNAKKTAEGKTFKAVVQLEALAAYIGQALETMQGELYAKAKAFMEANTFAAKNFTELAEQIELQRGFYKVFWCNGRACEATLKEISASARVIIGSGQGKDCFVCGQKAEYEIITAKAY